jgi:MinD superfamily P-loop ATPase
MKKITVISGKGGTGKTSIAGSFAVFADNEAVMADGDVDAANLSLLMNHKLLEEHEFRASSIAKIDPEQCNQCDLCRDLCRFSAISGEYVVNPVACEGCALCYHACPSRAVIMQETVSGHWFVSDTPYGTLVHARLGIAEENSGKLVTTVRNRAQELAKETGKEYVIIDGPPGIGCPVIASLSGVDLALIVTEPTVSGIHDLERVVAVCNHFGVPASVCINRYDLDEKQSAVIASYCNDRGLPLAGMIPFDRLFVEAMLAGVPVTAYRQGMLCNDIKKIWEQLA